ncbi:MAG: hypothetical protein K6T76_13005, partial [Alicyclobacillus mali]|uniref:hypothetical protein n=1 Tax=Alicyclobacillus mali (ex Roth et al. 2021) TaxID=1123961 RepID=UPI0023F4C897
AAVTNNQQTIVQAAQATVTGSGAPATWNGQPAIGASDVQIQTEDNGQLITAQVTYHAPVVFPQLMNWLGISSGWTQPITATATYYNELGNGSPGAFTATGNSTANLSNPPSSGSWSVSLVVSAPQTSYTRFFDGQSVTLTATANQDLSMAQGDALQIYDESTGQWLGMPVFAGTTDSVSITGADETDTLVALVGPWGTTNGASAQSSPLSLTWISPSDVAAYLSISASTGTESWNYATENGTNNEVWNGEAVTLTEQAQNIYIPSSAALSIYDETHGQTVSATSGGNSLTASVANTTSGSNLTVSYAAEVTYNGATYSTSSDGQNVEVIWLPNDSLTLADSYSGSSVTFTATANFALQGMNANGSYTDWAYLYNQSLGQWYQPQGVTSTTNQVSWTLPQSGCVGDSFVAFLETISTPTAGSYPQSAAQPPLESNSVTIYSISITGTATGANTFQLTITTTPSSDNWVNVYNQTTDTWISSYPLGGQASYTFTYTNEDSPSTIVAYLAPSSNTSAGALAVSNSLTLTNGVCTNKQVQTQASYTSITTTYAYSNTLTTSGTCEEVTGSDCSGIPIFEDTCPSSPSCTLSGEGWVQTPPTFCSGNPFPVYTTTYYYTYTCTSTSTAYCSAGTTYSCTSGSANATANTFNSCPSNVSLTQVSTNTSTVTCSGNTTVTNCTSGTVN